MSEIVTVVMSTPQSSFNFDTMSLPGDDSATTIREEPRERERELKK